MGCEMKDAWVPVRKAKIDGETIDVEAFYASDGDGPYFDLFDGDGECINEGAPLFREPTDDEIRLVLAAVAGKDVDLPADLVGGLLSVRGS